MGCLFHIGFIVSFCHSLSFGRGGKSSSNIGVGERLLSTLLTEMDGLEQAKVSIELRK